MCPDNAVIKLGHGKRLGFNYDYCNGCGLCVAKCPCGAIRLEPEPTRKVSSMKHDQTFVPKDRQIRIP